MHFLLHLLLQIFTFAVAFIFICCCMCVHLLLHRFTFIVAHAYMCCIIYLHLLVDMYTYVPTDVYNCHCTCSNCAVVHVYICINIYICINVYIYIYVHLYLSYLWLHICTSKNIKESMCHGTDICKYMCTHM